MANDSDIWIEKYRPKRFSEIKGQDTIVNKIEAFVKSRNLPHLLLAGPPGVGKTTLALTIAYEMYGENWHSHFLELNASDQRGIDIIRTKIKDFARTKAIEDVPFKIIYLDESDALTKDAQHALRRTMENYTHSTRFILSCNYSSKIIDPIQSRCALFRFKPLTQDYIYEIIDHITKQEGLSVSDDAKEALFSASGGDCRKVENLLQSSAIIDKNVTKELVYSLSSFANPKEIKEIITLASENKFIEARKKSTAVMLEQGLSGIDLIKQIQKQALDLNIPDHKKLALIKECGDVEFRLVEGSDQFVQIESLLAYLALLHEKD